MPTVGPEPTGDDDDTPGDGTPDEAPEGPGAARPDPNRVHTKNAATAKPESTSPATSSTPKTPPLRRLGACPGGPGGTYAGADGDGPRGKGAT